MRWEIYVEYVRQIRYVYKILVWKRDVKWSSRNR